MNKYKLINFVLFALSLLALVAIQIYWELVCKSGDCTSTLMEVVLGPLTQVSSVSSIVFGSLLFLPSHYFENWFKWIFLWMFPLYLILIYKLGDDSGQIISFPYALVAQILGYIFGGISLVFTLIRFAIVHQFKRKLK